MPHPKALFTRAQQAMPSSATRTNSGTNILLPRFTKNLAQSTNERSIS